MHEDRVEALGMLGGCTPTGAHVDPQDHGHISLTAEHIVHLGHLIENHVHASSCKINEHNLGYRPHTRQCSANTTAYEPGFGDRRINDTFGTELLQQAFGDLKNTPVATNVLSK